LKLDQESITTCNGHMFLPHKIFKSFNMYDETKFPFKLWMGITYGEGRGSKVHTHVVPTLYMECPLPQESFVPYSTISCWIKMIFLIQCHLRMMQSIISHWTLFWLLRLKISTLRFSIYNKYQNRHVIQYLRPVDSYSP
jgi:hypothetical protein